MSSQWLQTDNHLKIHVLQILEIDVESSMSELKVSLFFKEAFKKQFFRSLTASYCTWALLGFRNKRYPVQHRVSTLSKPSWAFSYFCHPSHNRVSANQMIKTRQISCLGRADQVTHLCPKMKRNFSWLQVSCIHSSSGHNCNKNVTDLFVHLSLLTLNSNLKVLQSHHIFSRRLGRYYYIVC